MFRKLKANIGRSILQLPGWHTNRKILIIESDDWGCWRSRDQNTLDKLRKSLPHIDEDPYNKYDTLETSTDLEALFYVLKSVTDKNGTNAILTANTIVANPDFQKIRESNFQKYHYKVYSEDLQGNTDRENLMTVVRQGIEDGIYRPQLHGREHLNVRLWLKHLRSGHKELRKAFAYEMFGIPLLEKINIRNNVMAALDYENINELEEQAQLIDEAQQIFKKLFGYTSVSFIAPSYIWHPKIESNLRDSGVELIQGLPYQYIPNPNGRWYKTKFRYTGKTSKLGLLNSVRNVFFEPSLQSTKDLMGECLTRIQMSFQLGKPAIIGSHRLNFIGGLREQNRTNNLKLLYQLLNRIIKQWPDVEFMSSDKLLQIKQHDIT